MLEYDTIDISEGIDINKSNDKSKECGICHYWYFLDINFSYSYLCNGCHDLMQKAMNFNDAAIVSVKGNDYRIHFWYMSKNDAISIMLNSNLIDEKGYNFLNIIFSIIFSIYKNESNNLLSKKQIYNVK